MTATARSLLRDGDVHLDENEEIIRLDRGFQIERRDGHAFYEVPLGTSLTALPTVAVASLLDGDELDVRLASGNTDRGRHLRRTHCRSDSGGDVRRRTSSQHATVESR